MVSLWTRDPKGDLTRAEFGLLAEARVDSFIVTFTDRRVIVHQGKNFDSRKSALLRSYPRDQLSVLLADPPEKPRHLDLHFGNEKDVRFTIQPVWRREAEAFTDGLTAPS